MSPPHVESVADLVCDMLAEVGVTHVFGVPGGPLLPLLDVLSDRRDIDFVLAKHEEGAVFMAEGFALSTGRLGVACVTAGPGATHALTAAASATSDWAPLLVLSGQVATSSFGLGALQDSSGGNWSLDTVEMFRSATKLSVAAGDPTQVPYLLNRAIRTALTGLPGAVHLSLPSNVLSRPAPATRRPVPPPRDHSLPPMKALAELATAIAAARNPVLLAGQGAKRSRAGSELVALAERTGMRVATTMKGKGVFPEDHPLALGVFGSYGGSPATHGPLLSTDVDLLLVLGSSLGEVSTFGWDPGLVTDRVVGQVDLDPLQLGRVFPVHHGIAGDVRTVVGGLLEILPATADRPLPPRRAAPTAAGLQGRHPVLRASAVAARLSETVPADTTLLVDNGNALCWIGEHFVSRVPSELHCSLNVASMGFSIAAAIGAKIASPHRPVIAVVGDAAFAMGAMEIHTAVEYGTPVIWIVLNNSGNAMVANVQHLLFGRAPGSLYTVAIDAAVIARGLGAQAARVDTLRELDAALAQALSDEAPWLIDVRVDGDEIPWALRGRSEVLRNDFTRPARTAS